MKYDIIIVGSGPAGMTAAIYGQRSGKTTLLLDEKGFGGQIVNTPQIENYPGIKEVSGMQFATDLRDQALSLGAELKTERVIKVESDEDGGYAVETSSGMYHCTTVILATGAKNRPLGIENEDKFVGSGISYCATCDGNFFRNRTVAVVGGGNTALEDAETLAAIAAKVYLVHRRDQFRGEDALVERLKAKENVEFVLDSVPEELEGDFAISGLKVKNVKTDESRLLEVQGIFVAIGQMPENSAFIDIVALDEKGYIAAREDCRTISPGVFVAGDCRTKKVRQLTTAAADGAVSALAAVEYCNQQ